VTTRQILAAERAVVLQRFRGSAAAYRAALTDAHATPQLARDAIGDQLRRSEIEAGFRVAPASPAAEAAFYLAYPDVLVRAVTAKPAAPWLGGRTSGLALSSTAPPQVFRIRTGRKVSMLTMDGRYAVKALGAAVPLGAIPLERARPAIAAALARFARGAEFERWTTRQQSAALDRTVCVHDDLPAPGAVDLSTFLPFLSPVG
jgi:hypothetical protein